VPKVRLCAAKAARSVRSGLNVFDSCMKPATAIRMDRYSGTMKVPCSLSEVTRFHALRLQHERLRASSSGPGAVHSGSIGVSERRHYARPLRAESVQLSAVQAG